MSLWSGRGGRAGDRGPTGPGRADGSGPGSDPHVAGTAHVFQRAGFTFPMGPRVSAALRWSEDDGGTDPGKRVALKTGPLPFAGLWVGPAPFLSPAGRGRRPSSKPAPGGRRNIRFFETVERLFLPRAGHTPKKTASPWKPPRRVRPGFSGTLDSGLAVAPGVGQPGGCGAVCGPAPAGRHVGPDDRGRDLGSGGGAAGLGWPPETGYSGVGGAGQKSGWVRRWRASAPSGGRWRA